MTLKNKNADIACRKLSFSQQNEICRALVPIGDHVSEYMDALKEKGFSAFVPHHEFIESFGVGSEDIAVHRKFLGELGKYYLTSAPHAKTKAELEQLYVSPFLQHLLDEQDRREGRPIRRFYRHIPGDKAIDVPNLDPCVHRMTQFMRHSKEVYAARRRTADESVRNWFLTEVPQHASGLSSTYAMWSPSPRSRLNFYDVVMERDATPLGFRYDKLKSRSNNPVFSNPITPDWDLCLGIENVKMLFFNLKQGSFIPRLTIRANLLHGEPKESGEVLEINCLSFLFGNAYWEFYSLDELETIIRAHLCLYSLMAPMTEGAIRKVLG